MEKRLPYILLQKTLGTLPSKTDKEIYQTPVAPEEGGNVTLGYNLFVPGDPLTLSKDTVLDLSGNHLSAEGGEYGDTVVIEGGANVVIKNGTILPSPNASVSNASAGIMVKSGNLTLENTKISGVYPVYLNDNEGSVFVISGVYTSPYENGVALYVQKGKKAVISGGTFGQPGHQSKFLLNLKDGLPTETLEVRGGRFYNFNPGESYSEPNGPVSFVPEGYIVTSDKQGEDIIYTVKKLS